MLHQDGGHGALGLVHLGFNDGADGRPVGVGLQVLHVGHQEDHLQELVDADLLLGRNGHHHGVAAPLFHHQARVAELLLHAVGVGPFLVDLVQGHDDGHLGRAGVVQGLQGLGLHAVVGGDHQDGDVGHLGAAGAHGREGLVARRVQEGDLAIVLFHLVGADVLGDAARLGGDDVGLADGVQQAGLAMVHVAKDGHHGRAGHQVALRLPPGSACAAG